MDPSATLIGVIAAAVGVIAVTVGASWRLSVKLAETRLEIAALRADFRSHFSAVAEYRIRTEADIASVRLGVEAVHADYATLRDTVTELQGDVAKLTWAHEQRRIPPPRPK